MNRGWVSATISPMTNIISCLVTKHHYLSVITAWWYLLVFLFLFLTSDLCWNIIELESEGQAQSLIEASRGQQKAHSLTWRANLKENQFCGKVREAKYKPLQDQGHWHWVEEGQESFDIYKHKLIVTERVVQSHKGLDDFIHFLLPPSNVFSTFCFCFHFLIY